jgi:hypothetical protein
MTLASSTRRRRHPARDLRRAVECLPIETKRAMLAGIEANTIIVGAYTDRNGGVCPMLAAHRNGGRTSFATFAKAWDRYTGAGSRPRRATEREILTLTAMLEASLASEERWDLATVAEEHRRLRERMRAEAPAPEPEPQRRPTGERDRSRELARRAGWAWLRPVRRYDDFAAALEALEDAERRAAPERELEPV